MNTRKTILFFLLILPFSLALVLVFHESVRTAVVIPLMYILWLGNLIFKSLDQSIYWVILLFIVGLVLVASLRTNKETLGRSGPAGIQQKKTGRVAFWENNLSLFHQGGRSEEYVMHELRNLVVTVLAYRDREHLTHGEIQRRLEREELDVPAEIRAWLLSKDPSINSYNDPFGSFKKGFLRILGKGDHRSTINSNDKNMERLLQFLEDKLEIKA